MDLFAAVETRESLEELDGVAALTQAARHNQFELSKVQAGITDAFARRDLEAMRQRTIRLSFLHTIEEEIYKRMPVQ